MHWSRYITLCSSSDVTKAAANLKEEQGTSFAWRGRWLGEGGDFYLPASQVPGSQHPENFCLYL